MLARPAAAANLQISPVSIQFARGQGAAGITLQNQGDDALFGQARVYVWEQRDGQDVLTPATDLVASPPVMEIAARSSQTIRLVRRGAAAGGDAAERSYRILIDELPRGEEAGGVAIRLQYSVPVFAAPADAGAAPRLSWDVYRKDGAWMLRVRNDGALHAQIGATVLRGADGKDLQVSKGLLGYALAGKTREWRLPVDGALDMGAPGAALAVSASVNAQPVSASASVRRE
ncbi:molecular chaperone [Massilia forsythiae]|uniref:Molecular chaperone n=2 Tax=Massilia forsythiae TaxID=2728020 RepID=A0A7Z2W2W8_9BURK|nr:molecular chaperone [Massilia forsythiae]